MVSFLFENAYIVKRTNTKEVELKSEFIPANSPVEVHKHMLFLHGLMGRGRNWRSIAYDRRVFFIKI